MHRIYFSIVLCVLSFAVTHRASGKLIKNNADTLSYFQIWNLCPASTSPIVGTMASPDLSQSINPLRPGYTSAYSASTPGQYKLELRTADGKQTLAPISFKMSRLHWTTLLIQLDEKGLPIARLMDDTYSFKATDPGSVTVYNYAPQVQMTCALSGDASQSLNGYGTSCVIGGFVNDSSLNAVINMPGSARPIPFTIPIDTKDCKRWAVIFTLDKDGNIEPSFAPLGYNARVFTDMMSVPDDEPEAKLPTPTPTPASQR